jgi:hypothetical protein
LPDSSLLLPFWQPDEAPERLAEQAVNLGAQRGAALLLRFGAAARRRRNKLFCSISRLDVIVCKTGRPLVDSFVEIVMASSLSNSFSRIRAVIIEVRFTASVLNCHQILSANGGEKNLCILLMRLSQR